MSVCNLLVAASPAFIQQESAAVFPLFWKQHSVNAQTAVGFLIRNPSRKNLLPLGMGGSLPFIKSCWHVSVSLWLLFPPLSPIIERQTICKLRTQKQKERNDMQCSPPTSFTGVSMSSIAIYSSLTFIPAIVSGVAPQITRKRHMGRAGTRFAVLLLLLVKAL